MGKSKTSEDYHALAKSRGLDWLGPEVRRVHDKTKWRCSKGHEWMTGYRVIAVGSGCPICMHNIKMPVDYYQLACAKGYRWLGPEVPNIGTKTVWMCKKGHYWIAAYKEASSRGCPLCAGVAPKVPEDYRTLAELNGYKWLGPVVRSTREKTWWICDNNHRLLKTYGSIRQGFNCPYCSGSRKSCRDYHDLARDRGFRWVGKSLPSVIDKTLWECNKGHQWEASFDSISRGNGCPHCAGNARKLPEDYHSLANERGFEWLGPEVRNNACKTKWICSKCHIWKSRYADIASGRGCPFCAREETSKRNKIMWKEGIFDNAFQSPTSIEILLAQALDKLEIDHQSQYRPDGYSKTYDEFIFPDILIEVHGDYWHGNPAVFTEGLSEMQQKRHQKDEEKAHWADKNGYHLVTMWEQEIKTRGIETLVAERLFPLLGRET